MEPAWPNLFAAAAVGSLAPVLVRLRSAVRGTALDAAWRSAAVVWVTWLVVTAVTVATVPALRWADVLWYSSAVLALTPPIAVLGARRPICRVWTAFVLVPLILVFAWPLVVTWGYSGGPTVFMVEEPLLVGYGLVLVMGAGNYLGVRSAPAAVLWMTGLLLIVLPLCPATTAWAPQATTGRLWGTLCLVAAAWVADRQAARRPGAMGDARSRLDRVWCDFRDLFGIVWARRVQERFNEEARQKGLPLRLGTHGLEDVDGKLTDGAGDSESLAAAETRLRWLLQKFVDPEWIDRRLGTQPGD